MSRFAPGRSPITQRPSHRLLCRQGRKALLPVSVACLQTLRVTRRVQLCLDGEMRS